MRQLPESLPEPATSPDATRRPAPRLRATCLGVAGLVTAFALVPREADAGAWTRAQGGALLSVPTTYTEADEAFNEDGNREDRLKFEMVEIAPLFEFGLHDRLTLGIQPKHRSVDVETADGGTVSNSGLAETDVYLRQNLWQDGDAAFSVQGLVKVPIDPQEDRPAALGRDQFDTELSLLYGNRIRGDASTFFYNFDVGYRKRFQEPDDQVSAGAFAGWSIDRWTFVVSSDNTIGLDNPEVNVNSDEVLTAGRSFTRHEAGLVATYRLTGSVSVSANASTTYAGEEVGAGNSYGLSAFAVW